MTTRAGTQTGPRPLARALVTVRSRSTGGSRLAALVGLAYVAIGFGVVAALVALTGGNLQEALSAWFNGAFGTGYDAVQTLAYATPLAVVALGVGPALQAGVITVGAEGQLLAGAILAAVVALHTPASVPGWWGLLLGAAAGTLGGILWCVVPAVARAWWGANEILTTLLANYLAGYLLAYLLRTWLADPAGAATPQSARLPTPFLLPQLPVPGRLHVAAVAVIGLTLAASRFSRSRTAFVIAVHRERPALAQRLGLGSGRVVLATMLVSGAAAGLAGWMQLAGVDERLRPGLSGGIGFSGLAVAVLGGGRPAGVLLAAVAYASLTTGATGIQIATGTTPAAIGTVTQAVLLLAAALAVATRTALSRRVGPSADPAPAEGGPVEPEPAEPRHPPGVTVA